MNALLIGKEVEIITSTNSTLARLKGIIVDETQNSFVIKTTKDNKRVLKNQCTFKINNEAIEGTNLQKRPYERIKNGTKR